VKTGPPEENMTKKDAMKFPFIGSLSLISLFILFKLLPAEAVNFTLSFYFLVAGCVATTATILPLAQHYFSESLQKRRYGPYRPRIPESLLRLIPSEKIKTQIKTSQDEFEISTSVPELVIGALCLAVCLAYMASKQWFFNNLLGLAFAIEGIEYLTITSTQTCILLFAGLFVYDIFWVFFTPVMVTVATSFDAPIKLIYPHPAQQLSSIARPFAMLGLGDIVIPGLVVSLVLRYDMSHHAGKPLFFTSAMTGYTVGLITTTIVMNVFKAAQPALLYIVPSVLSFILVHAAFSKELKKFLNHCAVTEHENNHGENRRAIDGRKDQ